MLEHLSQDPLGDQTELMIPYLYPSFMYELLGGYLTEKQIKERASMLNISYMPNIALSIHLLHKKDRTVFVEHDAMEELLFLTRQVFKYWDGAIVLSYLGKGVVLLPRCNRDLHIMKSEIELYTDQLLSLISHSNVADQLATAGVGRYYDSASMLHLSYAEACRAAQSYFLQGSRIIFFDDLDRNRDLSGSLCLYDNEQELLEMVRIGDTGAALSKLDDMMQALDTFSGEQLLSNLFMFLFEQLVILSRGVLAEGAHPKAAAEMKWQLTKELIGSGNDFKQMKQWANTMIIRFVNLVKEKTEKPSAWFVDEAEEFIARHYHHPLTLEYVAEKVHVSPAYLSRIFKEERQENFVQYLNKTRIYHAKQLLSKTQVEISEIASRVGFRNQNYFATVFRKQEGITPSEFRKKLQHSDDALKK